MDYEMIKKTVEGFAETEPWYVPLMSNVSALLYEEMEDINWLGFYVMKNGELVVGPFQGKVACIRIPVGKGVCGTAVRDDETIRVDDVHQFPGHIACDSASRSELVIPIHRDGGIIGVLDIDSPSPARFSKEDAEGLKSVVAVMEKHITLTP
ncbi:MAG: GAF domain-containing protein [Lachnospiraceae bacterium]|nr:GAF domain-containing protein [Lachnospiraceae bacterium]